MAVVDRLLVFSADALCDAPMNMAIDEAILEQASVPTLRFYGWQCPSISFGYFGKFEEVTPYQSTHELVRRWTGGGTVFHGEDQTYSLVIPRSSGRADDSSSSVYREVHSALRQALFESGLAAELLAESRSTVSNSCFASPVAADVMIGDVKVAGAAHRRTKSGLLHQGSIQSPGLPPHLCELFARFLTTKLEDRPLPGEIMERAREIARTRYGTREWLMRR